MSNEQSQSEAVWYFPPKRSKRGPVLLVITLSVVALLIAAAVVFFLVSRGAPTPEPTDTPTASATPTPTATPTSTPTPTPTPGATATPTASPAPEPPPTDTQPPPAPEEPTLSAFRGQVGPVLDSARTGLRYAQEDGGMMAMQDVMLLQDDAARLNGIPAPAEIRAQWRDALGTYADALERLRAAYERGDQAGSENTAATAALGELERLVAP